MAHIKTTLGAVCLPVAASIQTLGNILLAKGGLMEHRELANFTTQSAPSPGNELWVVLAPGTEPELLVPILRDLLFPLAVAPSPAPRGSSAPYSSAKNSENQCPALLLM